MQPFYKDSEGNKAKVSVAWNMFDGNKIENCGEGIRFWYTCDSPASPFETSFGIVFRRISISTAENYLIAGEWEGRGGKGVHIGMLDKSSAGYNHNDNGINGVLLEHITFEKCQDVDVRLYRMQGNVIIRDCKSDNEPLTTKVTSGARQPIIVK